MQEARRIQNTAGLPERMSAAQFQALLKSGSLSAGLPPARLAQDALSPPEKTPRARLNTPEEDLQIECFKAVALLELQHPILKWMVHVPNGGKRTKAQAGRLKAMGVKGGVLDVLLPRRYRGWPGLAIEMKSDKGRLTDDQKAWLEAFTEDGYVTGVARTLDEFLDLVTKYLSGDPQSVSKWRAPEKKPRSFLKNQ